MVTCLMSHASTHIVQILLRFICGLGRMNLPMSREAEIPSRWKSGTAKWDLQTSNSEEPLLHDVHVNNLEVYVKTCTRTC